MCQMKFCPIKYTRRYSYAKFGTFFPATRYTYICTHLASRSVDDTIYHHYHHNRCQAVQQSSTDNPRLTAMSTRLYTMPACYCHQHGSPAETITQWRVDWSSASVVNHTLLSDSQVSISLGKHDLRWTVSGQVKAHVVLTCTNGVSPNHLPVITTSNRPWTILSAPRAH